jgi:catechol 2,3-dioxygenase-like lactoylglutathione lyase family enzyme
VKDFLEAKNYYTEKLLFDFLWEWDKPPTFGCVRLGNVELFFCEGGQGNPGTWLFIFIQDVDGYCQRIKELGAEIIHGPEDKPWGMREIHVRDPNHHVIRFGQGLAPREPKLEI